MFLSKTLGRSLFVSCLLVSAGCGMRSTVTADADDPSLSQAGAAGGPVFERDAGPIEDPDGIGTGQGRGPCGTGVDGCDPNNLGGASCQSLNAGMGRLACDPVTCTYDLSMCGGSGLFGGEGGTNGGLFGGQAGGEGGNGGGNNGGFFGGNAGGNNGGFFGGNAGGDGDGEGGDGDGEGGDGDGDGND